MSSREDQVREALASEMPTVSFVQYGPDGTVALNVVTMYVCPLCGNCVPVPVDEKPEWQFPDWHVEHHLHIARQDDALDALREEVREMQASAEIPDPDGVPGETITVDTRPHSRACGWRMHKHGRDCHKNCPTCGGMSIRQEADRIARDDPSWEDIHRERAERAEREAATDD